MSVSRVISAVCLLSALTPAPALAYIDPLSGSVFLQAILAGILGAAVTLGRVGAAVRGAVSDLWRRLTG